VDFSVYRSKYVVTNDSGRRLVDSGDHIAALLRGATLDAVYAMVEAESGIPVQELQSRYENLNPGMQRMNLGNRLRALHRARDEA
jgi:hypothetical protein